MVLPCFATPYEVSMPVVNLHHTVKICESRCFRRNCMSSVRWLKKMWFWLTKNKQNENKYRSLLKELHRIWLIFSWFVHFQRENHCKYENRELFSIGESSKNGITFGCKSKTLFVGFVSDGVFGEINENRRWKWVFEAFESTDQKFYLFLFEILIS